MTDSNQRLGHARSNWRNVIMVCRKCERRLDDQGFGPHGRVRLAKALKSSVKAYAKARGLRSKGRAAPIGIAEIGCQKLCPRHGVTVVLASQPGCWLVAKKGVAAEEVLALAGLEVADRTPESRRPKTDH